MKQRSFSSNFTLLQYCCYGDWTSQFIVNRAHAIRHWMKCHSSLTNVEVRQWQWLLEMTGYYSHALLLLSYCAAWLKIDCWEEPLRWQGCNGCCRCHHCVVVSIVVIIVHISWRMHGHPCTEAVSSSSAGGFDNIFHHLPIITPFIVDPNDTLQWSLLDDRNDAELRIVSPHSMKWHENSK